MVRVVLGVDCCHWCWGTGRVMLGVLQSGIRQTDMTCDTDLRAYPKPGPGLFGLGRAFKADV